MGRDPAAADGRRERATVLAGWDDRVDAVLTRFEDARVAPDGHGHCPAQVLYDALRRDYGFGGSYQAVRRYLHRRFPHPVQAVRRVETPPGVQAKHDWFDVEGRIAGERRMLHGLIGTLSYSRGSFVWASPTMTQVAWQTGHLALFTRYGGVPLWVRLDNLRTAVASGAEPTARITPAFQVFASACRFAVDPCRAATGSDKGKVERRVRTDRGAFCGSLRGRVAVARGAAGSARSPRRRTACAVSLSDDGDHGRRSARDRARTAAARAQSARAFDCVVARRVSRDCLIAFEGRRYSVPFARVGREVEVRGSGPSVSMCNTPLT